MLTAGTLQSSARRAAPVSQQAASDRSNRSLRSVALSVTFLQGFGFRASGEMHVFNNTMHRSHRTRRGVSLWMRIR
jgi:hypothetical protein